MGNIDVPLQSRRLEGIKYVDTGKPELLDMKPILDVVNEALEAAGKTSRQAAQRD